MDPIRKVCAPWKYIKRDSNIKLEPGTEDQYTGPSGGTLAGPSQNIVRLAGTSESLACLCMSMISLSFSQQVADITNKYAYMEWVVNNTATYRDGNLETNNYLSR